MRIRRQAPKLGALSRWISELDVVGTPSEQTDETNGIRSTKKEHALEVLDAILRVVGPVDVSISDLS